LVAAPHTWTLRRFWWTGSVICGALQVLTIGLVSLGIAVFVLDSSQAQQLRAQELVATSLRQGMVEQQVAIGGYGASGDARLLGPYEGGRGRARVALQSLASQTAGSPAAGQVAEVATAAGAWQRWAQDLRQRVVAAAAPARDAATFQEGDRLFLALRAAENRLVRQQQEASRTAAARATRDWIMAEISLVLGSLAVSAALGITAGRGTARTVNPAKELAAVAAEIASTGHARVPNTERVDENGELARGLAAWQRASAEREILLRWAPLGICRVDRDGRITTASPAFERMLGFPEHGAAGRVFAEYLHPGDREGFVAACRSLAEGGLDRAELESRYVQAAGEVLWCSTVLAPLRDPDGRSRGLVAIVQDITERKKQLERAARIQRELLPRAAPELPGYDLAGACHPAQEVAGDLYDWSLSDQGRLDLTLADVMGKGVPAALVMTALRAVLRTAPRTVGPAARAQLAAEFMALGADEEGLFVTLFHGQLDLATGVLRYVDAGHGHCAIRRAGGDLERLPRHSPPLGMFPEVELTEGTVRLEPGDTLVVYSDGLVEHGERTGDLNEYRWQLDQAASAEELVRLLMRDLPAQPPDDVTVLVLHRATGAPAGPDDQLTGVRGARQTVGSAPGP
jgi:PAS domain S-box-containing protein